MSDTRPDFRLRVADWLSCDSQGAAISRSTVPSLPSLLRRRISAVGQNAFRAAWALQPRAASRFVFCSRHGEFDRTLRLLKSVAVQEELSPADFSLSVANALAGLLSMAAENTGGHTAIAAGEDSFAFGLLEAATGLALGSDERVLLVYFDDPLPEEYGELDDGPRHPIACAAMLEKPRGDADDIVLSPLTVAERAQAPRTASLAEDFIRFLTTGNDATSIGMRIGWRYGHAEPQR